MIRWNPRIHLPALIGVAVFALVGIYAGAALRPTARELIDPEGPQSVSPVSGARAQATGGGSAFANYRYGVPDYVIGTDWLQPEVPEAPQEPDEAAYKAPPYEPPAFAPMRDRPPEPAREPLQPRFPSMEGDIMATAPEPPQAPQPPDAPEPPEPPPA